MMDGIRTWLLAIIAASILCALAERVMPPGPVKRAGGLTCGLVLLWTILTPVARPDLGAGRAWLEDYLAALEQREMELSDQVDQGRKVLIEQEYAAYIVDKAAEWELNCTARVKCRAEEGLYIPDETMVAGPFSDVEQSRLTQMILEDLGVPAERQTYYAEGELP